MFKKHVLGEIWWFVRSSAALKVSKYRVLWSVFSCIQLKYRKIRTRKNSVFGHFLGSVLQKQKKIMLEKTCFQIVFEFFKNISRFSEKIKDQINTTYGK